jgi:hypothetical protein
MIFNSVYMIIGMTTNVKVVPAINAADEAGRMTV